MIDDWSRCGQCGGIRIAGGDSCLAHAEPGERAAALKRFSESGGLDVRGVTISNALLQEIFDAAPHNADGSPKFSAARFDGATFEGIAGFYGATFEGIAGFGGATFEGDAGFGGATFEGYAWFGGATFEGGAGFGEEAIFESDARFGKATFKGDAGFGEATFKRHALFEATFEGDARFDEATFEGYTRFGKATFEGDARFDKATFKRRAEFDKATFKDDAEFGKATFEDHARFDEATFKGHHARFGEATFEGYARFSKATFEGYAWFGEATFKGHHAWFDKATFEGYAWFDKATFKGHAGFGGATFKNGAGFAGATFKGHADFGGATFKNGAGFGRATFEDDARFGRATFEGEMPVLGPVAVEGTLDLDGVQFVSAVRIDTDASALTCRRGRFPGGVRFDVRRAVVRLDDSDLSGPSLLTGPPVSSPAGAGGQPRLLSLQGANVAGLALGNVSLADCRFAGAHNLDKLRLEANAVFGFSPAVAGWEGRQIIAEETTWRAARARSGRWKSPPWPGPGDQPEPLSPGFIAGLYRALRKGREDAKDEPGAADFYYGEMEMRRHDRATGNTNKWRGRASRIVLAAYWLISGYGLRAWRSLVALAVVTALFAVAFHYIGFTTPPKPASYWTSVLYAFRSTISLTDSQVVLTAWGSFFQALLRITGPVLLGLALLALRSRVKR